MSACVLLISDIDGTLLGDAGATARFASWRRAQGNRLVLAYATGRLFTSVAELVASGALPEPEFVIGGVGSQLRRFACGSIVSGWEDALPEGWDAAAVTRALRDAPRLEPQPDDCQGRGKASFYLRRASLKELDEIRDRLRCSGLLGELIYSSQRDLDVVPAGMHKGGAAAYLARVLCAEREKTIVCGDSGNDLTLFQFGFRGVVVANAHGELRSLAGDFVYHSPQAYADGVCDGAQYWLRRMETGVTH